MNLMRFHNCAQGEMIQLAFDYPMEKKEESRSDLSLPTQRAVLRFQGVSLKLKSAVFNFCLTLSTMVCSSWFTRHLLCVCVHPQNPKLMLQLLTKELDLTECMKAAVCDAASAKCMLNECVISCNGRCGESVELIGGVGSVNSTG